MFNNKIIITEIYIVDPTRPNERFKKSESVHLLHVEGCREGLRVGCGQENSLILVDNKIIHKNFVFMRWGDDWGGSKLVS